MQLNPNCWIIATLFTTSSWAKSEFMQCSGNLQYANNFRQEHSMSEEASNPFLGKPISLVTKAGVRYEGKLYTVVSFQSLSNRIAFFSILSALIIIR
jgi:hypothetical protein